MYYTIKGKTDGFGAQYQAILSGITYCKYKNYIYYHTPFIKIAHNTDVMKANEFIGIKTNEISNDSSLNIIVKPFINEVHYSKTPSIYYNEKAIEYIRTCYYSSKKPIIGEIDIAIHIRRGDVIKEKHPKRYIDTIFYIKIISILKKIYPEYNITIFSEGKYEDFKELELEEKCFQLNTDIFETFHGLVSSKVLITSHSSFSYCAGIINSNIVYHSNNCWHKKLDTWLDIDDLKSNIN